jgi:ribosome-binding factor A
MSTRTLRVNELLQRELSDILRQQYRDEAVAITITGVQVSPDIHEAKVFIAVTGDDDLTADRLRWLKHHSKEFRFELGRRIILKHMPAFTYALDSSTSRGNRILSVLDDIALKDAAKPAAPPAKEE